MRSTRNSTRKSENGELLPDYKTPLAKLLEKPYGDWSKKQREWFDKNVWGSARGRRPEQIHDDLYREMETARLSGKALT